jgi:Na+/proline symporter
VIIGIVMAKPLLGNAEQAFQFIQDFTGFFTPGIVVIFMLGMFWKRATTASALVAAIGGAALSGAFFVADKMGVFVIPFMNRVGVVFLLTLAAAVIVSLVAPQKKRGQRRVAGGGQLQDHQRLQHRRPGRDRDPDRPLRHLVVMRRRSAISSTAAFSLRLNSRPERSCEKRGGRCIL